MSSPTIRTWDSEVYSDLQDNRLLPPIETNHINVNDKPQKLVTEAGLLKALGGGRRFNVDWSVTYNLKQFLDEVVFLHKIWLYPSWLDMVLSTTSNDSSPDYLPVSHALFNAALELDNEIKAAIAEAYPHLTSQQATALNIYLYGDFEVLLPNVSVKVPLVNDPAPAPVPAPATAAAATGEAKEETATAPAPETQEVRSSLFDTSPEHQPLMST